MINVTLGAGNQRDDSGIGIEEISGEVFEDLHQLERFNRENYIVKIAGQVGNTRVISAVEIWAVDGVDDG